MRVIPFLTKKPKIEIIPVGSDLTGYVYLLKRGFICPNENPVEHQEQAKKQRQFFTAYNKRVKDIAKEENMTPAAVRDMLSNLQAGERGEVAVDDGKSLLDYLDEQTLELMYTLQEDTRTLAIRAATFMLQYRAATPVVLKNDAEAGSRKLVVEPLSLPLGAGAKLRFDDYEIEVRDFANIGETSVMVKDLPVPLKAAQVGFLCDSETSQIKVGFPDWTVEDTSSNIGEELIAELYRFYQVEAGEAAELEDVAELPEGEEVESDEAGEPQSSTGVQSTSDSSTSDVPIPA